MERAGVLLGASWRQRADGLDAEKVGGGVAWVETPGCGGTGR